VGGKPTGPQGAGSLVFFEQIKDAAPQLKARVKPGQPAMLAIYNNANVVRGFTGPHEIMPAMYGRLEYVSTRSHGQVARLKSVTYRLGGNRGLTPEHNTTISAIGALFEGPGGPYLVAYHNRLASNPIPREVLRRPRILQYSVRNGGPRVLSEWVAV
jgi:hypothetical protein